MKPKHSRAKKACKADDQRYTPCDPPAFSAEDKIRIVIDGLRGDYRIAELYRREGIAQSLYYTCCKEFMEAGKR